LPQLEHEKELLLERTADGRFFATKPIARRPGLTRPERVDPDAMFLMKADDRCLRFAKG
jgi:hypothetical protein